MEAAPPDAMTQWGNRTDENSLRDESGDRADKIFYEMLEFDPPSVRFVEKNFSPTSVEDPLFIDRLKAIKEKRHVPKKSLSRCSPRAVLHQSSRGYRTRHEYVRGRDV